MRIMLSWRRGRVVSNNQQYLPTFGAKILISTSHPYLPSKMPVVTLDVPWAIVLIATSAQYKMIGNERGGQHAAWLHLESF
jgi:hypothetical protein